ncbi:MAG: glutamate ligase domain-containing protein, partial [Actinomycetota bacterium]
VRSNDGVTSFVVSEPGGIETRIVSPLRGLHNVSNVTAVIAMLRSLSIDTRHVVEAVESFAGVNRRFEIVGTVHGATLVDDYAHLPREIDAVLSAARSSDDGWRRVVAVFQPNRFNRMAVMSDEYGVAFGSADILVLTDIYASGTAPIPGVDGRLVVSAVERVRPDLEIVYEPDRARLATVVAGLLREGDVCISMGCGDIESLPREILSLRGA